MLHANVMLQELTHYEKITFSQHVLVFASQNSLIHIGSFTLKSVNMSPYLEKNPQLSEEVLALL